MSKVKDYFLNSDIEYTHDDAMEEIFREKELEIEAHRAFLSKLGLQKEFAFFEKNYREEQSE